jgi:hypothetical protein
VTVAYISSNYSNVPIHRANRVANPVVMDRIQPVKPEDGEDGDAHLSLENKLDLSQKASAMPTAPPARKSGRSSKSSRIKKAKQSGKTTKDRAVRTTDNLGRICSGSLNGPLLMEEAGSQTPGYSSEGFKFEHDHDFQAVQAAGKALASLTPDRLLAPRGRSSQKIDSEAGPAYAYRGVRGGEAVLVQRFARGEVTTPAGELRTGAVEFPDGQTAFIARRPTSRGGSQTEIRLPSTALSQLADWGRELLAIA